jgi:hypothetical protein
MHSGGARSEVQTAWRSEKVSSLRAVVSGTSNTDPASIRCELLKPQFNGSPFRPHLTLSKHGPEHSISSAKMNSIAGQRASEPQDRSSSPAHSIEVPPEIVRKWQEFVNLLAEIMHVPSASIMRADPPTSKFSSPARPKEILASRVLSIRDLIARPS